MVNHFLVGVKEKCLNLLWRNAHPGFDDSVKRDGNVSAAGHNGYSMLMPRMASKQYKNTASQHDVVWNGRDVVRTPTHNMPLDIHGIENPSYDLNMRIDGNTTVLLRADLKEYVGVAKQEDDAYSAVHSLYYDVCQGEKPSINVAQQSGDITNTAGIGHDGRATARGMVEGRVCSSYHRFSA